MKKYFLVSLDLYFSSGEKKNRNIPADYEFIIILWNINAHPHMALSIYADFGAQI